MMESRPICETSAGAGTGDEEFRHSGALLASGFPSRPLSAWLARSLARSCLVVGVCFLHFSPVVERADRAWPVPSTSIGATLRGANHQTNG